MPGPQDKTVQRYCIDALQKAGSPIIIVAAVREAEALVLACQKLGITVAALCDTEFRKSEKPFRGLEIIHTPLLKSRFPEARFLIASQHVVDVELQLTGFGYSEIFSGLELLEHFDAYEHDDLTISQSYMTTRLAGYRKTHEAYFDDSKLYMRSLDIMVTTKCSLKCESCSNLMQYYEDPEDTSAVSILAAIDILSGHVDEISEFRIIGGEPLMNKGWSDIVRGILDRHPDRRIFIYTNGTIAPKKQQLDLVQDTNVNFVITDYSELSRFADQLTVSLDARNISYVRTPAENWLDCSDLRHHTRTSDALREVFNQCCVKYVYTLLEGRLYRCPFIANAANLKAIPDNKANYVDLLEPSGRLGNHIQRLVQTRNPFPACNFCVGRPYDPSGTLGYDGQGMIQAGIQTPSPLPYQHFD